MERIGFKALLICAILLIAGGELVARYYLGLGDPPLSVEDPSIEYMFKPNQDVMRFGNRQLYNEYSMRSIPIGDVSAKRRVVVFGDSVINGGSQTDQTKLATTRASNDQVFFGNVSAGSWGPENFQGWIERNGFVGSDTAIFVLSSHDVTDFPTFQPLNPNTHPTEKPFLALWEGISRYLPRILPSLRQSQTTEEGPAVPSISDVERGQHSVSRLIDSVSRGGIRVCFVLHPTQTELAVGTEPGRKLIEEVLSERNVPWVDTAASLRAAIAAGNSPYRDNIHLNDAGQALLQDALSSCDEIAVPVGR